MECRRHRSNERDCFVFCAAVELCISLNTSMVVVVGGGVKSVQANQNQTKSAGQRQPTKAVPVRYNRYNAREKKLKPTDMASLSTPPALSGRELSLPACGQASRRAEGWAHQNRTRSISDPQRRGANVLRQERENLRPAFFSLPLLLYCVPTSLLHTSVCSLSRACLSEAPCVFCFVCVCLRALLTRPG